MPHQFKFFGCAHKYLIKYKLTITNTSKNCRSSPRKDSNLSKKALNRELHITRSPRKIKFVRRMSNAKHRMYRNTAKALTRRLISYGCIALLYAPALKVNITAPLESSDQNEERRKHRPRLGSHMTACKKREITGYPLKKKYINYRRYYYHIHTYTKRTRPSENY